MSYYCENCEERAEAAERDAARYRWLRRQCDGSPPWAETDGAWMSPDALDSAIDKAAVTLLKE